LFRFRVPTAVVDDVYQIVQRSSSLDGVWAKFLFLNGKRSPVEPLGFRKVAKTLCG
jgi:hypothetical protein